MHQNILLCTLGASWPVVPEVYALLAPAALPLYLHHTAARELDSLRHTWNLQAPDEIWICTTTGKETNHSVRLLRAWHALLPSPPTLRIWQAEGTDQLASGHECDVFRELLLRVCLHARDSAELGQLVLSLAGGRKTMSADLQWAGQLFGCQALIHVVARDQPSMPLLGDDPTLFAGPLPVQLAEQLVPLVRGHCRRNDLLDVNMDGLGMVRPDRFPVPMPDPNSRIAWSPPESLTLTAEILAREKAGSQLFGNFIQSLAKRETHENWRSLYRLPPQVIDRLHQTPIDESMRDWLRDLPKADLHRHVGGCLTLDDQRIVGQAVWDDLTSLEQTAATKQVKPLLDARTWPADWPLRLRAPVPRAHCAAALLTLADNEQLEHNLYGWTMPRVALKTRHSCGFSAYERPGDLSGSALLCHPTAIEPYAARIVEGAVAEGLHYVELRGSPQKYGDGLAFLRTFHSAIQLARNTIVPTARPTVRFIVIVDRRIAERTDDVAAVVQMAVQAKRVLPEFVVGLDLAGDEGQSQPESLAHCFMAAFEHCLPLTIHAGEGEPAESIWQAAYHLHADRIGHGLTLSEHAPLANRVRDRAICLELCPTSNREVVGFRDPGVPESADCPEYPFQSLWNAGTPLSVCTDNPGISRTTMAKELLTLARMTPGGLSCWDVLAILHQGFRFAFLPAVERAELIRLADAATYQTVLREFETAG